MCLLESLRQKTPGHFKKKNKKQKQKNPKQLSHFLLPMDFKHRALGNSGTLLQGVACTQLNGHNCVKSCMYHIGGILKG